MVVQEGDIYDWSSGLEDADDSQLYFYPEQGVKRLHIKQFSSLWLKNTSTMEAPLHTTVFTGQN